MKIIQFLSYIADLKRNLWGKTKRKKYPLIERKRKYRNRNDQEWVEEEDEYEDSIIVVQVDARIDKKNKPMKTFVMDSNQKRIKDFIHQYME